MSFRISVVSLRSCFLAAASLLLIAGCNSEPGAAVPAADTGQSAQGDSPRATEGGQERAPAGSQQTARPAPDMPPPTLTLYDAVVNRDMEQIRASIAHGADPDELTYDERGNGFAPLHSAARMGNLEIIQLLVDAGANVSIEADAQHRATPLHWAARAGQLEAAKLLVESGANVNAEAGIGGPRTPARLALDRGFHDIVEFLQAHGGRID